MKKQAILVLILIVCGLILIGCIAPEETPVPTAAASETPQPSTTPAPIETVIIEATATPVDDAKNEESTVTSTAIPPSPTPFDPANWRELPVIPTVSERVREIYQVGQEMERNSAAFIKIGDCGSATDWYLMDFDRGEEFFDLGEYGELQVVIEQFAGSFERRSVAAVDGFRASSILSEFWADPDECVFGETPLSCELRIMNPTFAIITMGTNDVTKIEAFEPGLRRILDELINAGVVPILATKADNLEGDYAVNQIIASVALEYELPLWNFWAAVNELPDGGLQEDGAHLTWGSNFFNDPKELENGWPVRNLTALQVLNAVWRGCTGQ